MQYLMFRKVDLSKFLERRKAALKSEVESFERDYLLNTSEEDLKKFLLDKYLVEAPVLREEEIYVVSQSEVNIDVSQDPLRGIIDRSRPFYIKGVLIKIALPFNGDSKLFQFNPSSFDLNPPRGEIEGQEVHLEYKRTEHDAEEIKKTYKKDVNKIRKYLSWVKQDVDKFNGELKNFVNEVIKKKKEKHFKDLELVSKLGIPIKKREDMPKTYAVPKVKRKPKISKPVSTEKPFEPEPALESEEYENILDIIRNMAMVLERSPSAFENMKEEDLRQHFLVQLNGQYGGSATGETFNYQGKTDILIRYKGRNAFIAECKYWTGEKGLLETIDQLLSYTSWRDTKTSIILFNRRKNFSAVLDKIPKVVKSHKCFKRELERKEETEYRFVLHQPDDPNRELILRVMAFDVPVSGKAPADK